MNALPRQKLRELISRHGSILCTDPLRCEKLLQEACPRESRAVNLLMSGLRALVAVDLRDASPAVPIQKTIGKLIKRLEAEETLTPELAKWVVESWALALRKVSEAELTGKAPPQPDESRLKAFEYSKDGLILPPKKKLGEAGAVTISEADLTLSGEESKPGEATSAVEKKPSEESESRPTEPMAGKAAAPESPKNAGTAKPAENSPPAEPPRGAAAGGPANSKPAQTAEQTKPDSPKPAVPAPKEGKPGQVPVPVHEVEMPLVHPAPSPLAPVPHVPRRGALGLIFLLLFGLVAGVSAWWYFFREVVRESEEVVAAKKKRRRRKTGQKSG